MTHGILRTFLHLALTLLLSTYHGRISDEEQKKPTAN